MADNEMDVLIDDEGNICYVYSDALDSLFEGEARTTVRASHVEPASDFGLGVGWVADMGPSGGGVLVQDGELHGLCVGEDFDDPAVRPFRTRQEALDAERSWLREHRGL